jgi:Kef-type K+ transport system membrane component KefB
LASTLILIGSILLAAYAAHGFGRRVHVPRVTLLLLIGVLVGPAGFGVVPDVAEAAFPLITNLALAMVGFLLGERLALREMHGDGRIAVVVSIGVSLTSAAFVFAVVWAMTRNITVSLILAGIAPATAPAATVDVVRESKAQGSLSNAVLRVVALDDAWSVILFTVLLVTAENIAGLGTVVSGVGAAVWEVGGAVMLGAALGVPMAWLTGRVKRGEPTLLEAAGFVFLAAGLAQLTGFSYLITCMTVGATVANLARHHTRPFRAIGGISDPFLSIFFFLAGYEFDMAAFSAVGLLGLAYIGARVLGRVVGGYWSARVSNAEADLARRIGWCLLPQAGVAVGLVLLAVERLPETRTIVLPLVITTTVVFELIGPVATLRQLRAAGEVPAQ